MSRRQVIPPFQAPGGAGGDRKSVFMTTGYVRLSLLVAVSVAVLSPEPVSAETQDRGFFSEFEYLVEPSLVITQAYDDNIYRESSDDLIENDWITTLSPQLKLGMGRGSFRGIVDLGYTAGRYAEESVNDYDDYGTALNVRWELDHRNELAFISRYDLRHEARGTGLTEDNPDLVDEPIEYSETYYEGRYQLGSGNSIGRLTLALSQNDKQYENFTILTSRRDYLLTQAEADFSYQVAGRTRAQVAWIVGEVEYDNNPEAVAGAPDTLDSDTNEWLLGVDWNATGKSNASILVGYREKDFVDPDREDFSGPSWQVDARWAPRTYMAFTLATSREDRETNGEGSFIDTRRYNLGWETEWSSRFGSELALARSVNDYQGSQSGRTDTNVTTSFELEYNMRYWLRLGLRLLHQDNDSDVDNFDYKRKLALVYVDIAAD